MKAMSDRILKEYFNQRQECSKSHHYEKKLRKTLEEKDMQVDMHGNFFSLHKGPINHYTIKLSTNCSVNVETLMQDKLGTTSSVGYIKQQ